MKTVRERLCEARSACIHVLACVCVCVCVFGEGILAAYAVLFAGYERGTGAGGWDWA